MQGVVADDRAAYAQIVARYTFSATGRRVGNRIASTFAMRGRRIVRHVDRFDLWRWSRQALGPTGALFGWSPLLGRAIRRQAANALSKWRARGPA